MSLADVMKGCRHSKPLHVSLTKSDIECEADRDACHQQTMLKRPFVMPSDFVKPLVQAVSRDVRDDLRRGMFGIRQVDRLAFTRR